MNIKKYLNQFHWYENENDIKVSEKGVMDNEYPSNFQIHFGIIPVNFLRLTDNVLPYYNFRKFQKYLISQGFISYELSSSNYKFVHLERKIVIFGDVYTKIQTSEDEEDDISYDGVEVPISVGSDENMFISISPTLSNKIFIEKVIKKLSNFFVDVSKDDARFYLIAENQRGLFTKKTTFKSFPIKDDRYDIFYGENFPHEKLKKFVTDETENLLLLHGSPGTGKSNYIKHIITNSKKKVIYIPPSMLSVISSPGFVSFMMQNTNAILLIEDAEEVLSVNRNSATNNLLGLTDGFLRDALNLKIIATFNCDIGQIDPALMRKGRLYLEYHFRKLTVDECLKLSKFVGFERKVDEDMTLADFFNIEDNHFDSSLNERKIGFL